MKKILLPVDLVEAPEALFRFAARLAAIEPTEITLLHIVEFPVVPSNFMQPMDYVGELYAATLSSHEEKLKALTGHPLLAGLTVRTHQLSGALRGPGEEIASYADAMEADLVLAYSKHRKGLQQLFAGSELLRIVRFCRRPLMVLSDDHPVQLNRFAFATDFSEMSAEVYRRLKGLSDWLGARLMVFHVNTLADFVSQRQFSQKRTAFQNMLGPGELDVVDSYNDWGLEAGIANYAEDHAADVIVMATHGRKGLSHLFFGSLTENLVQHTTFPMLILNGWD